MKAPLIGPSQRVYDELLIVDLYKVGLKTLSIPGLYFSLKIPPYSYNCLHVCSFQTYTNTRTHKKETQPHTHTHTHTYSIHTYTHTHPLDSDVTFTTVSGSWQNNANPNDRLKDSLAGT